MDNHKWYYSTWFISLNFFLGLLIIPFFIGVILLIMKYQYEKEMTDLLNEVGFGEVVQVNEKLKKLKSEYNQIVSDIKKKETSALTNLREKETTALNNLREKESQAYSKLKQKEAEVVNKYRYLTTEIQTKSQRLTDLQREVLIFEEEAEMQLHGFYDPEYEMMTSQKYKERIEQIRDKQKQLVKDNQAIKFLRNVPDMESYVKNDKFYKNLFKLMVYSFNKECDIILAKVKAGNLDQIEKRILKAYEDINKLNEMNHVALRKTYFHAKRDEMFLILKYEKKKEAEREEQRLIKEQMREEEKVRQEMEAIKQKIEKEEKHFQQAIQQMQQQYQAVNNEQKELLEQKIRELQQQLATTQKNKQNVLEREQNTRAGYVYIISNIGSFGQNVYKIGMTRRLEPLDRVKELGDASVPFLFDVHAMIFSEDAPALENALHNTFHHRRVNKANPRKEFFRVSLDEIAQVVKQNHNKVVQFTKIANAEEYHETLRLESETYQKSS